MTLGQLDESRRLVEALQPVLKEIGYSLVTFDAHEVWGHTADHKPTDEWVTQLTISIMPSKYAHCAF